MITRSHVGAAVLTEQRADYTKDTSWFLLAPPATVTGEEAEDMPSL